MKSKNTAPIPEYLIIIQARLGSTRLPGKVLMTVGGVPIVKRVWLAAKATGIKTVVAWPERYPDVDENDVRERFKRLLLEFPCTNFIRLTADCPLITSNDILAAIDSFKENGIYYCNQNDGHDVQVIHTRWFMNCITNNKITDKEHVIYSYRETPSLGLSVDTKQDLERVRQSCKIKSS